MMMKYPRFAGWLLAILCGSLFLTPVPAQEGRTLGSEGAPTAIQPTQYPSGPDDPFVHPGRYTVRLYANRVVTEKPLQIRMDPRVSATAADIRLQTDYSMRCDWAYVSLQQVREAIDSRLAEGGLPPARAGLLRKFRGAGTPGLPDLLYGSISQTPLERESVVGLQQKLLFLLSLLQGADARPTLQAVEAVEQLEEGRRSLLERWRKMRETG